MASTTPSNPPATSASGSGTSGATTDITLPTVSVAASNLTIPSGTPLEVLSGLNWNTWSGVLCAILQFLDVDSILIYNTCPNVVDADDWSTIQKKITAYMHLHCWVDIFPTMELDVNFPTFKHKFDQLNKMYV